MSNNDSLTVREWIVLLFLIVIPFVNIILLIVWATNANESTKRNFSRAYLIVIAFFIGLAVLLGIVGSLFSSSNDNSIEQLSYQQSQIPEQINDIEVVELKIVKDDDQRFDHYNLEGVVRNNSITTTYNSFHFNFNLYDDEGIVIGNLEVDRPDITGLQKITLRPGEKMKFKEWINYSEVPKSVQLITINAY